jgi:two-component system nitrogen regulation response regulator NtrX
MQKARWKGNVRELRNTVERLLIMTPGDTIDVDDLPRRRPLDRRPARRRGRAGGDAGTSRAGRCASSRRSAERKFLVEKLRENAWNISKTAEVIGTPRSNLYKKLEQYQITRSRRIGQDGSTGRKCELNGDSIGLPPSLRLRRGTMNPSQ